MINHIQKFRFEIIITFLLSSIFYIFKFYTIEDEYKHIYEYKFNNYILLNDYLSEKEITDFFQLFNEARFQILEHTPINMRDQYNSTITDYSIIFKNISIFDYNHHKAYRPLYDFTSNYKKDNFNLVIINYHSDLQDDIRIRIYINSPKKNDKEFKKNLLSFENHLLQFFNNRINKALVLNLKDLEIFGEDILDKHLFEKGMLYKEKVKKFRYTINQINNLINQFEFNDTAYLYDKIIVKKNKNNNYNHILLTIIFLFILIFIRKSINKSD